MNRWNPFREIDEMMDRYNRLFAQGRALSSGGSESGGKEVMTKADWTPAVDISETAAAYVVKAELPEVKKEDVKVAVHDRVLMLSGERRFEKEEGDKKHHRIERMYGSFSRSFTLPDDADEENVSAEYKDGVLTLSIPKAQKVKPRSIEVKVS